MSFYCPYCNRIKSGKKKTPEEKTKEHFVPQSVGGKWVVPICKKCNGYAGRNSDAFFAKVAKLYNVYANGIIETDGLAILKDGSQIPSIFKYQTHNNGHHQFFYCTNLTDKKNIVKDDIQSLRFHANNPQEIIDSHPTLMKIALAGIYYLLRKNNAWTDDNEKKFKGLGFADFRKKVIKDFNPGGNGNGLGSKDSIIG